MNPELIAALKLLTDPTRLRILGALAAGPHTVDALTSELGLPRRTLLRSLGSLQRGGLLEIGGGPGDRGDYRLRRGALAMLGAELDLLERGGAVPSALATDAPGAWTAEERKVLNGFLVEGRLSTIPAGERKRLLVLRFLAESAFEPGRDYPEREVNMLLALRYPDVAALRRYLVDAGFMQRAAGVYRLRPESDWPTMRAARGRSPISEPPDGS
jgi:DNA-binding transcriptional ArsR family regulator